MCIFCKAGPSVELTCTLQVVPIVAPCTVLIWALPAWKYASINNKKAPVAETTSALVESLRVN